MFPYIHRDFISKEMAAELVEYAESSTNWDNGVKVDFWNNRIMHIASVPESPVRQFMIETRRRIIKTLQEHLGDDTPLYGDNLQLTRWMEGYEMHPHADAENPGGQPHPFPWRDYASIIYLNDNFDDGEIYWPNKDLILKPEPGMLAIFPGTLEFLHGVKETRNGNRYTAAAFLTRDASHWDGL